MSALAVVAAVVMALSAPTTEGNRLAAGLLRSFHGTSLLSPNESSCQGGGRTMGVLCWSWTHDTCRSQPCVTRCMRAGQL